MSNNEFLDAMHDFNKTAKNFGFDNGKDWAEAARNCEIIDDNTFRVICIDHTVRVGIAHGHAREIEVSDETTDFVEALPEAVAIAGIVKQNGKVRTIY